MEAINISLSLNDSKQDWRVEIDGRLHEHVLSETLDSLVEDALAAAQRKLLTGETSTDRSRSESFVAASD
jgi:hypothetical protein